MFDGLLHIYDYNGRPAHCRCVVQTVGRTNQQTKLVMFVESADNPGMSITNASELFATAIVREKQLNPNRCVFVEHYPHDPDHYECVTYEWFRSNAGLSAPWTAERADWTPITRGTVELMLGEPPQEGEPNAENFAPDLR